MDSKTTKPLIKESHHVILAEDGDICIGEIPAVSQIIQSPPAWVAAVLQKMDGKRTLPRIIKELEHEGIMVTADDVHAFIDALAEKKLLQDNTYFSTALTGAEIERYNRQIIQFSLIDADNCHPYIYQERLKNSSITIFGLGGWGTWCALQLAMAGVGTLTLIDGDNIELSNLNRQVLYNSSDIGKSKVAAAKDTILAHNEHVNVNTYFEFATRDRHRLETLIGDSSFIVLAWAALGYYRKETVQELIYDIAQRQGIPVLELGGDPLEISVGPIYLNDGRHPGFDDVKHKVHDLFYHKDNQVKKFQEARLKHAFLDGTRQVNAWQSAPSLSVMAGLATDQIIKTITRYDSPTLIGKRFYLSLVDFKTREEVLFDYPCS